MKTSSPLAGFLQEELLRQVNKEAEQEWSKIPPVPLPKFKRSKITFPQWIKNALRGTLGSIKQLTP